ncbi:MAG: hypothetical protein ACLT1W_06880 [Alistipes onderdonkii]
MRDRSGLFRNRLTIAVDWYRKITSDLLLSADIPPSSGFSTNTMNIGKVRNQGWEFTLRPRISHEKLPLDDRFQHRLQPQQGAGTVAQSGEHRQCHLLQQRLYHQNRQADGHAYGYTYEGTYKYDDFDNVDGKWVLKADIPDNGTGRSGVQPGDARFRDINGDGTVNADDCTIIGRGQPLHTGGFNSTFEFFGFDLNVFSNGITAMTSSTPRARSSYAANRSRLQPLEGVLRTLDPKIR